MKTLKLKMNLVLLLVFATIVIKVTLCNEIIKCCSADEVLVKEENSFNCSKDLTQRHQIYAKTIDFLKNSISGQCIDVFNNKFVSYDIDTKIIKYHTDRFFPKCCPLNRVYNSELHSCVESLSSDLNYINESFVKVGLPNCKIITDFDLDGIEDYQYNLLNFTTNIKRNTLIDPNSFCFDKNERGLFLLRECQEGFDICKNIKCIKKCCPDGQSFMNGSKCIDTYEHGLNLSALNNAIENHEEKYAIIHNRTCRQIYKMSPKANIKVHRNGSFTEWTSNNPRTVNVNDMNSYCIEHSTRKNLSGYSFFHCFLEKQEFSKFDSRKWPFTLSCIFLLLTILVYALIKEYKKMFGKILMNYCLTSFLLFVLLLWNQLTVHPDPTECEIKSFLLIFIALAQFTWANVMSFEIWCTFGTTKLYLGTKHKELEFRKFLLYSFYAWGLPLILTLTVFLFYEWRILPDAIQPYLAHKKCFFEYRQGNYAKLLFFGIPLLIIQMINMAFFVKTVIYCMKVKNEINKINDATTAYSSRKYQHDKERLFLIIKLSIVMGISYIFEVVTSFFNMSQLGDGPKYLEIVLDIYNALQGVFIFIIFICKKKVLYACLQKFNITIRKNQNSASTRTQSSLTLNGVVLNNFGSRDKVNNNKL